MTPLQQNEFLARYMGWEKKQLGSRETIGWVDVNGKMPLTHGGFVYFNSSWDWFQKAYQKYRTDFPTNPEVQGQIERFFTTNDLPSAVETLIQAIKENEHHITTPNFPTS